MDSTGCKLLNFVLKLFERLYFCPMKSRRAKKVFTQVKVLDAAAKGKSIAKAPDGRVLFINNAIPGDVVTVQTTKKKSLLRSHSHRVSRILKGPCRSSLSSFWGMRWV